MEFEQIPALSITYMLIGAVLFTVTPIVIAIVWLVKKKERVSTVLAGAVIFLLFALILEKPIQNILIFPTVMGLPDHAAARFINERPLLWSLLVGFFPGLFEETGRFAAFRTVLKKHKNRETSISYGIGHGGFEVILIAGLTYISYISYALTINAGMFGTVVEQVAAQAPDKVDTLYVFADTLAAFSFGDLFIAAFERVFAVLLHIGFSILVFYACRDKKKFMLYPLAILLHTAIDAVVALNVAKVITLSPWGLEMIACVAGLAVFFVPYCLIYRKDKNEDNQSD